MVNLQRVAATALILMLCSTAAAKGQNYILPPCATGKTPRFEDHLQSLWYRRFWTGDCRDLPVLGCRSGQPYWNDVVRRISDRAPAYRRKDVEARACRLGARIGFEWTRPKKERRIDSQDLKAFNNELDHAPDMLVGLSNIEASVRRKIGG